MLLDHSWPGNSSRAAPRAAHRLCAADGEPITRVHPPSGPPRPQRGAGHGCAVARSATPPCRSSAVYRGQRAQGFLLQLLEQHRWNVSNVAEGARCQPTPLPQAPQASHRSYRAAASTVAQNSRRRFAWWSFEESLAWCALDLFLSDAAEEVLPIYKLAIEELRPRLARAFGCCATRPPARAGGHAERRHYDMVPAQVTNQQHGSPSARSALATRRRPTCSRRPASWHPGHRVAATAGGRHLLAADDWVTLNRGGSSSTTSSGCAPSRVVRGGARRPSSSCRRAGQHIVFLTGHLAKPRRAGRHRCRAVHLGGARHGRAGLMGRDGQATPRAGPVDRAQWRRSRGRLHDRTLPRHIEASSAHYGHHGRVSRRRHRIRTPGAGAGPDDGGECGAESGHDDAAGRRERELTMNYQIFETVLTTMAADGRVHAAPMGVQGRPRGGGHRPSPRPR